MAIWAWHLTSLDFFDCVPNLLPMLYFLCIFPNLVKILHFTCIIDFQYWQSIFEHSLCVRVLKQEIYSCFLYKSSINSREQLINRIEAIVRQISPYQCLATTRAVHTNCNICIVARGIFWTISTLSKWINKTWISNEKIQK